MEGVRVSGRIVGILSVCVLALALCLMLSGAARAQEAQTSDSSEPAWDGTYRRIRAPILMYHYVSELPRDADDTRLDLTTTPQTFHEHLDYLVSHGYTPISLYQLDDALLIGTPLPDQPVVLTFDDGYADHYAVVFPLLRQFGFTATFFIITGMADDHDPEHLSWEQIRTMSEAGMDMESHTKTHPDLRGRSYDFLVYELLGSAQSLEAYTGKTPHMFAYPSGQYDDETLTVLKTLSVWRAVTTNPGITATTDNRLELPRQRIHNYTGVDQLAELLIGNQKPA